MPPCRSQSTWICALLVTLCVQLAPSVGRGACPQNPEERQAIWSEHYAPHFGNGHFLDNWALYPYCFEVLAPGVGSEGSLSILKLTESFGELSVTSASGYPLFLDTKTFGELAFVLLKAEQEAKSLTWLLNSDGGWFDVSLVLLEMLQNMNAPTQLLIHGKDICFSACLILAAGFPSTFADPEALFGFHGASQGGSLSIEGTKKYLATLRTLGVDSDFLRNLESQGVFDQLEFLLLPASQLQGAGLFGALLEKNI